METKPPVWNGYAVHGDTSLLDYIVEAEGYINLCRVDIDYTLSEAGYNCVAYGQGPTLTDAFNNCVAKLGDAFHNASKILIQFIIGSLNVGMPLTKEITTALNRVHTDVCICWGVAPDATLGHNFKVIIVSSF